MRKILFQYFLPGAGLIVLGFFAALQQNIFLGLLSFLAFFVIGVTLIVEGFKKKNGSN
jgi:hypothetical protein